MGGCRPARAGRDRGRTRPVRRLRPVRRRRVVQRDRRARRARRGQPHRGRLRLRPSFSIWTTIEECPVECVIFEQDAAGCRGSPFSEPVTFDSGLGRRMRQCQLKGAAHAALDKTEPLRRAGRRVLAPQGASPRPARPGDAGRPVAPQDLCRRALDTGTGDGCTASCACLVPRRRQPQIHRYLPRGLTDRDRWPNAAHRGLETASSRRPDHELPTSGPDVFARPFLDCSLRCSARHRGDRRNSRLRHG